jgi:hypothetical protein
MSDNGGCTPLWNVGHLHGAALQKPVSHSRSRDHENQEFHSDKLFSAPLFIICDRGSSVRVIWRLFQYMNQELGKYIDDFPQL